MRHLFHLLLALTLVAPYAFTNSAFAVTVDLFSLMNHNSTYYGGEDVIYLGDAFGETYRDYSSYPAIEEFALPLTPIAGGQFEVFITWSLADYSNNSFSINSVGPFVLTRGAGSRGFTGNNSDLLAMNTLQFNLDKNGGNYEDMLVTAFSLEYEGAENNTPSPVPEPSTILLFGSGLLGLSWYGRKRKKE